MKEQNSPHVFSEWLKRRRKALDMTQDELATRVGCSVSALRKIETGERRPSKQLAALLADALQIPEEDQATFMRVARGELNLQRLGQPLPGPTRPLPDIASLRQPGAAPSLMAPLTRIPLQTTPLIGREAELAAMERLFKDPQCRLLTLTGIGGIGKTRLAIEFALRKQADFAGGVFYIPLTSVDSPEKIAPTIADVLGFGFSGPSDPKEQLLNYIASQIRQPLLFVFDNLEHLLALPAESAGIPGVVRLTAEILQRLPSAKILGTSRERLNIHGEWTYELHGLSVPQCDYAGALEEYAAIALFISSARRIRSDFQADAEEQVAMIQIARLVAGVPLAIELAAAWVGMLSCREIASEIQSNMDFLSTSVRDIPERHRSIRSTFDHSWKLLSSQEREALCQLAVFQGGFDREAALQIAEATLPILASLSAKSLVRRTESGRFDLHEVIRQYALHHLSHHPLSLETYARHCEFYLRLVQAHERQLKSDAQQDAIRHLSAEIDNIRAAWAWAIEHRKINLLERAARGFGWYYEISGLYREGIEQLELLAQVLRNGPQDEQCCRLLGLALIHQALLNFRKGEFDRARRLYEESILLLRRVDDQVLLADALVFLGTILHLQGDYEPAMSSLEEGLAYARQSQERYFEAWAIYNIGYVVSLLGRYEQGYEQMQAGIAIWRSLGDPQAIALGLNFMVTTLNKLGRYEEAKTYMHESIALCEQSKNRWGLGTAYRFLGLTYLACGQYAQARAHLQKSLEIFGEFAIGWDIARSLAYLGDAAFLAGDYPEATKIYRDALLTSLKVQATPIALDVLVGLSELDACSGRPENALLFCYYILSHPASEAETKSRAERLCAVIEPGLNPPQVAAARAMAAQNSFDQITNIALTRSWENP